MSQRIAYPTKSQIETYYDVDVTNGSIHHKSTTRKAGYLISDTGYMGLRTNKFAGGGTNFRMYLQHKLIWICAYDDNNFPHTHSVDHIDHNRSNNTITNLRLVTIHQNSCKMSTNSTGYPGVHFNVRMKKYTAQIEINAKTKHLGTFTDPLQAYMTYRKEVLRIHGAYPADDQQLLTQGVTK